MTEYKIRMNGDMGAAALISGWTVLIFAMKLTRALLRVILSLTLIATYIFL